MKTSNSSQQFHPNNKMTCNKKTESAQIPPNFSTYLLEDYTFLSEYQLLDSPINTQTQFLAKIKTTEQLVKFIKKPFSPTNTLKGLNMYKRFQAMFQMFQKGLVLADNMFILEQGNNTYFYYIIEPYLTSGSLSDIDMPFVTLQQYLFENRQQMQGFQPRKTLFIKCKNLIDNLFQTGQSYCGLNSRNIVIDDEANAFLMPYSLEFAISSKPYERSYYPIEVLKHLQTNSNKEPLKCLQKWDIWSFGCISVEIFLYLTPYFMSTSVESQIKRISSQSYMILQNFRTEFMDSIQGQISAYSQSQCSINNNIQVEIDEVKKIMNFLRNVLQQDESKRAISFDSSETSNEIQNLNCKRTSRLVKKYQRNICPKIQRENQKNTKNQPINKNTYLISQNPTARSSISGLLSLRKTQQNFNELNIWHKKEDLEANILEKYEFEMKFKSFCIENYKNSMDNQMEVMVEFSNSQKFKFFIDMPKNQDQNGLFEIQINKKITFSNKQFEYVENLLNEDVVIRVSFNNNKKPETKSNSLIFINLSALTIKDDKSKRIWNKPIKGTYASQSEDLLNCKIKIQARLTDLQELKRQTITTQRPVLMDSKQINRMDQFSSRQNKALEKEQSALQQVQQTSRFREPLAEKCTIDRNSQNQQALKTQKPIMRPKDLSAKIRKLLMR